MKSFLNKQYKNHKNPKELEILLSYSYKNSYSGQFT